jgi:hypothetical protein
VQLIAEQLGVDAGVLEVDLTVGGKGALLRELWVL